MDNKKESKSRIHIGIVGDVDDGKGTLSVAIHRYLSSWSKVPNGVPPAADGKFIHKRGE